MINLLEKIKINSPRLLNLIEDTGRMSMVIGGISGNTEMIITGMAIYQSYQNTYVWRKYNG